MSGRLDDVEVGSPALGVGGHGYRCPVPGETLLSGGPLVLATGHQAPKRTGKDWPCPQCAFIFSPKGP